jgi:hypothetical protein
MFVVASLLARHARTGRQLVLIWVGVPTTILVGFIALGILSDAIFAGRLFASPQVPAISGPSATPAHTVVAVEKIEQWAGDVANVPAPGDVFVTVELSITPAGLDPFIDVLDTMVHAGDGTSYGALFDERVPAFPVGFVTAGTPIKGWMTFQVPSDLAGHLILTYPDGLNGPLLSFDLY